MEIKLDQMEGDLLQISLLGAITSVELQSRHDPFNDAIGQTGYDRRFLVSLADTDFIDSSGIGWLLATHKQIESAGGSLVLHSTPPDVKNVFQMMRLDRVLRIEPTYEDALVSLESEMQEGK